MEFPANPVPLTGPRRGKSIWTHGDVIAEGSRAASIIFLEHNLTIKRPGRLIGGFVQAKQSPLASRGR